MGFNNQLRVGGFSEGAGVYVGSAERSNGDLQEGEWESFIDENSMQISKNVYWELSVLKCHVPSLNLNRFYYYRSDYYKHTVA